MFLKVLYHKNCYVVVGDQGYPNRNKGWGESEILIFLQGARNLRRSDFNNSNLFES